MLSLLATHARVGLYRAFGTYLYTTLGFASRCGLNQWELGESKSV
jgi:hypothetical protein